MSRNRSKPARHAYEVGYGKPPAHAQFQPGRSGNPKGRPRKSPSQENALQRVLAQPVPIVTDGKRKTVPASEALFHKLLQMALSGNIRALNTLTRLVAAQQAPQEAPSDEDEVMVPEDEDVIARYLERQDGMMRMPAAASTGGRDE